MQSSKYYDTVFHLKKEFTKSSLVLYLSFILVTWSLLQISLTDFFENNDHILIKISSVYSQDDGGNGDGDPGFGHTAQPVDNQYPAITPVRSRQHGDPCGTGFGAGSGRAPQFGPAASSAGHRRNNTIVGARPRRHSRFVDNRLFDGKLRAPLRR